MTAQYGTVRTVTVCIHFGRVPSACQLTDRIGAVSSFTKEDEKQRFHKVTMKQTYQNRLLFLETERGGVRYGTVGISSKLVVIHTPKS